MVLVALIGFTLSIFFLLKAIISLIFREESKFKRDTVLLVLSALITVVGAFNVPEKTIVSASNNDKAHSIAKESMKVSKVDNSKKENDLMPSKIAEESHREDLGFENVGFQLALNDELMQIHREDLSITQFDLEEGENKNSFEHFYSEEFVIWGFVDKETNRVLEVQILLETTNKASADDFLDLTRSLIQTAAPSLSLEEAEEVMREIGLLNGDASQVLNDIVVREDIEFYAKAHGLDFASFTATPVTMY